MSDVVRELFLELLRDITGPTLKQCSDAFLALDAEREAYDRNLTECHRIRHDTQNERDNLLEKVEQLTDENDDLRKRIAELEAQLQDER